MHAGEILGNYRIVKLLGQGGMGEVYLAIDQRLGRQVAFKVISDQVVKEETRQTRFQREASAAASLNHPSICAIYDFGEIEGRPFIAMEYVEGVGLDERILNGPLQIPEVLEIAVQIAEALDEAGKKGVVHRDVKASNIMLTERNQVKLLDFGLAKLNRVPMEIRDTITPSPPGGILGTVDYMSPEQLLGEEVDHRSDIFSFGVVLYQMITARLPFPGNTITETIDSILNENPFPVERHNDKAPAALSRVVGKMLQKDLEDRYQSVREVWIDLSRIKTEPTQRGFSLQTPKTYLSWIIRVFILMAALLAVYLFWPRPPLSRVQNTEGILALPCNVYGSEDIHYLTDAIPNSLSTLLAGVQSLQIRVPPTSLEVESAQGDLNRIAEAYGLSNLVLSSVSEEGNQLILNVQLVEFPSRKVLWSNQYEGSIQNYVALTRQVADGIRQALRPDSGTIVSASSIASNSETELAFHRGRYYSNRFNRLRNLQDFEESRSAFVRALELDPKLADAAAEIALLYQDRRNVTSVEANENEIEIWAQKALEINPRCSRAWSVLSRRELVQPVVNQKRLMDFAVKAAFFDPKDSTGHMTLNLALSPISINLSLKAAEEVHRIDPLYPYAAVYLTDPLIVLGRSKEALPLIDNLLRVDPDTQIALYYKAIILSGLGQTDEAAAILQRLETIVKEGRFPENLLLVAEEIQALQKGDWNLAASLRKRILMTNDPVANLFDVDLTAPLLVRHGKTEEALQVLTRGLEVNMVPYDLLMMNPELNTLEKDARFQKIFAGSRARFQEVVRFLNQCKERDELPPYLIAPLADLSAKLKL